MGFSTLVVSRVLLLVTGKLLYPIIENQKFDCLESNSTTLLNSTGVLQGFVQIPDFMYKH